MSVTPANYSVAPLLSAKNMAFPNGLKAVSAEGMENARTAQVKPLQQDSGVLWDPKSKQQTALETHSRAQNSSKMTALWQQSEQMLQHSQTMSLSLTTREGDQVELDFRQLFAQYQAQQNSQVSQQNNNGAHFFASREAMEATEFTEKFAFSVQGDLNETELAAISDVFAQVGRLATDFFNGDLEQALSQALEMKIDFSQLSGMQMDLTQTKVMTKSYQQAAAAQYQGVQNTANEAAMQDNQAGNQATQAPDMSQLPVYLQQWQTALERLDEQFAHARKSLNEWVAQVVSQDASQTSLKGEESSVKASQTQTSQAWIARMSHFHAQLEQWAENGSADTPAEKVAQDKSSLPGQAQIDNATPRVASDDKQTSNLEF